MNNKGFVLAETLLVSAIVLLSFTLLYKNGIPLINQYITIRNYDDMDTVYIANLFQQILVSDDNYMDILNEVNTKQYMDLTDCNKLSNVSLCKSYKDMNEIKENDKIIISVNQPTKLENDILNGTYSVNRNFKEYVEYLNNKVSENAVNNYVLIISRSIDVKKRVVEDAQIKEITKEVTKFASVDLGGE